MNIEIRKACAADSAKLAELMNIAGEGIPAYLWRDMAGADEDVIAYGARRVAQAQGGFSYANAHVAQHDNAIVGMLLGYRLADPYPDVPSETTPPVVRPLLELEALVPGSWYVNAVATDAASRGQGVGTALMALAESLARASGAPLMSLIVADENRGARTLYERLGYQSVASRPIVGFPGCPHRGDWLLMTRVRLSMR